MAIAIPTNPRKKASPTASVPVCERGASWFCSCRTSSKMAPPRERADTHAGGNQSGAEPEGQAVGVCRLRVSDHLKLLEEEPETGDDKAETHHGQASSNPREQSALGSEIIAESCLHGVGRNGVLGQACVPPMIAILSSAAVLSLSPMEDEMPERTMGRRCQLPAGRPIGSPPSDAAG